MCHVLIIEDEVLFALELSLILMAAGATSFDVAETENEAIYAASVKRPDIITSDIKLRSGSGLQAVATILSALGSVPVIFITASPEACHALPGRMRVLGKPLHETAIARAFREMAPPTFAHQAAQAYGGLAAIAPAVAALSPRPQP